MHPAAPVLSNPCTSLPLSSIYPSVNSCPFSPHATSMPVSSLHHPLQSNVIRLCTLISLPCNEAPLVHWPKHRAWPNDSGEDESRSAHGGRADHACACGRSSDRHSTAHAAAHDLLTPLIIAHCSNQLHCKRHGSLRQPPTPTAAHRPAGPTPELGPPLRIHRLPTLHTGSLKVSVVAAGGLQATLHEREARPCARLDRQALTAGASCAQLKGGSRRSGCRPGGGAIRRGGLPGSLAWHDPAAPREG